MTRERDESRIPDLLLERYRLGELPEAETRQLRERLDADPDLKARLDALESSDREIRHRYPPGWLAEAVRARASARRPAPARRPWRQRWLSPAALAAAAVLALVLAPQLTSPPDAVSPGTPAPGEEPVHRVKGAEARLLLFRRTPEGSEPLSDGDSARAGDVIRLGYRTAGRFYGVIVSIDGRGAITRHLPLGDGRAARLRSGESVLLGQAYELDDAPRFERFYLVTSSAPFEVESVLEALRNEADPASSDASLRLPPHLSQASFLLLKGVSS
jgi:hypothetical protein